MKSGNRKRSRKGPVRPRRRSAHRKTHTKHNFTTEQSRVYRALQQGPKTSLELVVELGVLGIYPRISELRRMSVRIDSHREVYLKEDGSTGRRTVYTLVDGGSHDQ